MLSSRGARLRRTVLIVSALQVFPPLSGGNRRTAMIAEGLAGAGYDVRIYSLIGRKADMLKRIPSGEVKIGENIREFVSRNVALWLVAMVFYRFGWPPFWAEMALRWNIFIGHYRQWRRSGPLLILDFPFVLGGAREFDGKVILNTHNVEQNLKWGSGFLGRWLTQRVANIEAEAAKRSEAVVCSSSEEVLFLTRVAPGRPIIHVANCVDGSRFNGGEPLRVATRRELGVKPHQRVLLFAASAYGPNRQGFEFLRDFSARHQQALTSAGILILIVGSVSKVPERTSSFAVLGPVAAIEPYFAASDWGLNPIFQGSGTSVKLAEMIAADLPVLTTEIGMRGFDLTPEQDALFFTGDDLIGVLTRLPQDGSEMARKARAANTRFLDPAAAVRPLTAVIDA
jgi:Glycosyl transferases group 1